jgi:hypothetical protein
MAEPTVDNILGIFGPDGHIQPLMKQNLGVFVLHLL